MFTFLTIFSKINNAKLSLILIHFNKKLKALKLKKKIIHYFIFKLNYGNWIRKISKK